MSTLAAAKADNFYYPPGWTPEQGSLNKYHGQHPLRERARKLGQGILIIRFEMPFHVWCGGCGAMIAKGVRFNAEKKQIGNYHSTKIWSFKMKSACCQTEIEIHTDPKNCDYVVVSGAEKKVVEYDAEEAGTTALPTEEERERLADPFSRVEHLGEDTRKAKSRKPELTRLKLASDARHADTWRLNSVLRRELRAQKKRVAAEEAESRSKGLAIRLLPETEVDREAAAAAKFSGRFEENRRDRRAAINGSSIFAMPVKVPGGEPPGSRPSSGQEVREGSVPSSAIRRLASGSMGAEAVCNARKRHCRSTKSEALKGGSQDSRGVASSHSSSLERRMQLAVKRRRIDGRGVLEVASGKV